MSSVHCRFQVQAVELLLLLGQIHEAAGAPLTALPYVLSCLLHSTVLHMDLLVCPCDLQSLLVSQCLGLVQHGDTYVLTWKADMLLLVSAVYNKHFAQLVMSALFCSADTQCTRACRQQVHAKTGFTICWAWCYRLHRLA